MEGATRVEINFNRLWNQCQLMAEDEKNRDWRFQQYVKALQSLLIKLKTTQSKPTQEKLQDYQKKVDLLRGLAEAEKKHSVIERALITDKLRPISQDPGSVSARQLQVKAKARCEENVRAELLGPVKKSLTQNGHDGLRERNKPQEDEDINTILQHHHRMQERLAEEMLLHARTLKQNVTNAGHVVRDDTKRIADSTRQADINMSKLKVESERLEAHTKSCSWWIWLMLFLVIMTFISMVLFMRIFSK